MIAVAVATSRTLLGVHWVTDVVAGLFVGWGWFLLVAIAFGGRAQRLGDPTSSHPQGLGPPTATDVRRGGAGAQIVSEAGRTVNSSRVVRPLAPPSSSKRCCSSRSTEISTPWPRWAWSDSVWRRRAALTRTLSHSLSPVAVTTATSRRPSVGSAAGSAVSPPFSVPMLPTSTHVSWPSKNGAPSTVTTAANGSPRAGVPKARADVGEHPEPALVGVGVGDHPGVEAGAGHHVERQVVADRAVDQPAVAADDEVDDVGRVGGQRERRGRTGSPCPPAARRGPSGCRRAPGTPPARFRRRRRRSRRRRRVRRPPATALVAFFALRTIVHGASSPASARAAVRARRVDALILVRGRRPRRWS